MDQDIELEVELNNLQNNRDSILNHPELAVDMEEVNKMNAKSLAFDLATRFHDKGEGVSVSTAVKTATELFKWITNNPRLHNIRPDIWDTALTSSKSLDEFQRTVWQLVEYFYPEKEAS